MAENTEQENTQNNESAKQEVFSNAEPKQNDKSVKAAVADFENFEESDQRDLNTDGKLQFLKDLQLNVFIELGRTQMQIKDVLELERGYVIELDKLASEPVDVFVNNKKIAEGEVVVIDKHFGIRITNLNEGSQRLKDLY